MIISRIRRAMATIVWGSRRLSMRPHHVPLIQALVIRRGGQEGSGDAWSETVWEPERHEIEMLRHGGQLVLRQSVSDPRRVGVYVQHQDHTLRVDPATSQEGREACSSR